MLKQTLDDSIETLHFDEAWLPHATFHDFYKDMHAIGKDRPRSKDALIFATHSTHKLLAGISQASQIIVQESRDAQARPPHLQRGVPDAHVDVAAVRDHRVVRRVGGDDGAARRHGAGRGVDHRGARLPPRDAQGRRRVGQGLVVQGLGPGAPRARGHRQARRLAAAREREVARLRQPRAGLQHPRPDQGDGDHAGARRVGQVREDRHPGVDRHQVPRRARRHRREDRALLVLHHVHHRHHQGPLEHAGDRAAAVQGRLRQEPAAVADPAGVRAPSSRSTSASACATSASRSTTCTRRTTSRG